MLHVVLLAGWLLSQSASTLVDPIPAGNTIVTPSSDGSLTPSGPGVKTSSSSGNVTVNITPPPPDPAALRASTNFAIDSWEFDHASVPVNWANALLKGENIWTTTPAGWFNNFVVAGMRNSAKNAALGLFMIGILWTGAQLVWGSATGTASAMQLLPLAITGFLLAVYADSIAVRSIDLCNWLNRQLGEISIVDFTGTALTLPEQPDVTAPGVIAVPAGFVSGILSSLVYAIILLILELKMYFRLAVLTIADVVMPISAVLWAFQITRGWGLKLYVMFFGWLFGQPLVVVCLALSGALLTFLNVDPASVVLVKVGILFAAIKVVSLFSNSLGGGGMFGIAGLLFLLRRGQGMLRHGASSAATTTAAQPAAAVQSGQSGGTGSGGAATGRPWRPAFGTP